MRCVSYTQCPGLRISVLVEPVYGEVYIFALSCGPCYQGGEELLRRFYKNARRFFLLPEVIMLQTVGFDLLTTSSGRENISPHLAEEYNSRIQFEGCLQPGQKPDDFTLAKVELQEFANSLCTALTVC